MSFALVGHTSQPGSATSTTTTPDIDTTGADLLIAAWSYYGAGDPATVTVDSLGNTWTTLPVITGSSIVYARLAYCKNPVVGAGHHIGISGAGTIYAPLAFAAFSGADLTAPYNSDIVVNRTLAATSLQPGSLTPPSNGCLVVTLQGDLDSSAAATVDAPFASNVIESRVYVPGTSFGVGVAYEVQTTATARNPTWTGASSVERLAFIASFKPSSASAAVLDYYRNHL